MKQALSRRGLLASAVVSLLGFIGSALGRRRQTSAAVGAEAANNFGCENYVCPCGQYCIRSYPIDGWPGPGAQSGRVTTYVYSGDGRLLHRSGTTTTVTYDLSPRQPPA